VTISINLPITKPHFQVFKTRDSKHKDWRVETTLKN